MRDDLVKLINRAEKNGQVCGLLTDGIKLADKDYLNALLQSGLDHVMLLLEADNPRSWQAVEAIIPEDLFLTVHFTLNKKNANESKNILQRLAELGVENISLSAAEDSLSDKLLELQDSAAAQGIAIRWDLPVPYSASNSVAFETADEETPQGAGKTWMYVEPDGDVLPAQGQADKVLGNLLRDEWQTIFKQ